MANPIIPVGFVGGSDIFETARQQDEERRTREVVNYIARTGHIPPPVREHSPLIEDDVRPDIADDGDSYNNLGSVSSAMDNIFGHSYMEPSESRRTRMEAVTQEQNQKEQAEQVRIQKEKEEIEMLRQVAKKRFSNPISGLSLND
jgi:hypothetical protein